MTTAPGAEDATADAGHQEQVAGTGDADRPVLLLVDDDPQRRSLVASLLGPHCTVLVGHDRADALEAVGRHTIDVLVLGSTRSGLLTEVRARPASAAVPAILLTCRAEDDAVLQGLQSGLDDLLSVPSSAHDVLTGLRSALDAARSDHLDRAWRSAVLAANQEGCCIVDGAGGAIVSANAAATDLLGLRPEDVPFGPPHPFLPAAEEDPEGFALVESAWTRASTEERGRAVVPLRHVTTRARVWVSVSYSELPVGSRGGRSYLATLHDVTAARRAAERDALLARAAALPTEPGPLAERLRRFLPIIARVLGGRVEVELRGPDGRSEPVAAAPGARQVGNGHDGDDLVVPLVGTDRVLGTLRVAGLDLATTSDTGTAEGSRAEVDMAELLARRIAAAVDADRVAERATRLHEVTTALASAGTLLETARALVDGVRRALATSSAAVYAVAPDGLHLHLVHRHDGDPGRASGEPVLRVDGPGAVARAAAGRGPVWPPTSTGPIAAIPLTVGERVVGVLAVERSGSGHLLPDERDFAATLAGQAAQAFERAALADQRWQLARALQRALLPTSLPAFAHLALAAHYEPAQQEFEAGGDWYDVFALGPARVALVVGDVVGQGPTAAAVMGQLRSVVSAYLHDGHSPAQALEGLDRAARRIPGARGSTALCLTIDTDSGDVAWSAAGHVPPLIAGPDGTRFAQGGQGALLGVSDRAPYGEGRETVVPGTTVALYTDGLVERRGQVVDDGLQRLAAVAERGHQRPPGELLDVLLAEVLGSDTGDDVALVLARLVPRPLERRLDADPLLLPGLRHDVHAWAVAAGMSEDGADDLQLALSEAATNCVEHAYAGGAGEIRCRVHRTADGAVEASVQDFGAWRPPPADPGYRGRGLAVIHTLAEHVELHPTPQGTTIVFRIPASTEPLAQRAPGGSAPQWWTRQERPGPGTVPGC
ncbi:SpoIIE family protein phosphatase [Pseudonocardia sp. KRD-184]|uniref:SpoIIE family protein phosphatase n=1 Tax=Pseudonocardia oceani TaxID=2792013 RepID=A0ABS6U398_9PSEU|nr:SpoIIE family protein phosphatase [Pseudonocardia oceani]MBW0089054.1 SpoIIE family protein phosphatase [Pseudonocardia oceani]MBW0094687.1 SpoIIE family protein phosphatase [Pseudonocardia oceani]MBW0107236.1 SpoIIE family protein phosphatase [Pseudonocardia oceani]MBW0119791.1 SpoIIE family protein phosphatase [Pseudonocardia oceani]MBW0126693.1 SpoIIE family protein phosphatase [Pseudonocardia oceani]